MKTSSKNWLLILFVCSFPLLLAGGGALGVRLYGNWLEKKIRQVDHQELLEACRGMMESVDVYAKSGGTDPIPELIEVSIESKEFQRRNVPDSVRRLNPRYVVVSRNMVVICVSAVPRVYVYAFKKNTQEGGSKKLIDGLWIGRSSYSPSTGQFTGTYPQDNRTLSPHSSNDTKEK